MLLQNELFASNKGKKISKAIFNLFNETDIILKPFLKNNKLEDGKFNIKKDHFHLN